MIKRPEDLIPKIMIEEFRRLAALPIPWATIEELDYPKFKVTPHVSTWLRGVSTTASDYCSHIAACAWIKDGPKIARVSETLYQLFSKVDVRMELKDFSMPFHTIVVDLPPGKLHKAVLVHRYSSSIMVMMCISHDYENDITTMVRQMPGTFVEASLEKYDDGLQDISDFTCQSLRVSCNMMLALSNFGHQCEAMFPKEVERDRKLGGEQSERGKKAR